MIIKGITASTTGNVSGTVRVIRSHTDIHDIQHGDIVVMMGGEIDLITYFPRIRGIVTEEGSILQHAAIVAREFEIPCIVCAKGITSNVHTGQFVELNLENGEVNIIE